MIDETLWRECFHIIPTTKPNESDLPVNIGFVDSGIKVLIVDGDKVKINHDMDFVEAGNGYRWPFIPKDELWLDNNIELHDLAFNLFHEAHERRDMAAGMSYDEAHPKANAVEKILRERAQHGQYAPKMSRGIPYYRQEAPIERETYEED